MGPCAVHRRARCSRYAWLALCALEVADDLCAIMSCRRGRLTRPVCAQPNPRRVEREFAPRAEPATITLKYMSRRSCVVLATHVFDGLDDWPTHIAFVSRATKCARCRPLRARTRGRVMCA